MTSQKEILNVQNILNGTTESAIAAAQELSKIPGILQGFESIGLDKVKITQDDDLQNYLANLDLLGQKAQSAAGHLVTLSSDMSQQSKYYKDGVANGTLLNSKLYEQQLNTTSLTEADKKLLLQQSGLITNTGKYTIAQTASVQAAIEGTDAFANMTVVEQQEVVAAIADTTAKQTQTAATVSLTAAQNALNVAMTIGKQILLGIGVAAVTAAITALVKVIANSIPTYDNLKQKNQEAAQAFEDAGQKVTELETKLADVKKQMDECKDSDSGKIVDQESFDLLEHQKELLETNLRLARQNREEAAKEANQAVYNQFNAGDRNPGTGKQENIAETIQRNIENYKYWQKQIDDTTESLQKAGAGEQAIADQTALATQMRDAARDEITKYSGDLETLSNQLLQNGDDGTKAYKETAQALTDAENATSNFIDFYENGIPYITQATNEFNSAVSDGSEKAQALADAIADGNVEKGSEAYEYASELAEQYKVSVDDLIDKLEELHNAQENVSDGPDWDVDTTGELAQFMESLSDSSSDLYAKTKALTSAYNDMYTSQKLSSDSIQSLIAAYPELISQMETENGVTTISKDILCDKFDAMKGAMVATIESEIQATQTAIAEAQTRIATYKAEIQAIVALYSAIGTVAAGAAAGSAGAFKQIDNMSKEEYDAYNRYVTAQQGIADMEDTIVKANEKLADQKKALDVLNNLTLPNYAGATKGASKANKGATQAAKENKKALEAQKKEAEKTKKALENYSKTLKAQGDAIIKVLDKRKDALEKEKDARDKAWDAEKKQLEEEKKLKDKAYEKEKEALQEKKQALQDANDEEDRAIKLAQLQDALAKAQSQRTKRVYQHDTGFEWQVDEGAVSDAQNNLDDQQRAWKREDAIAAVEKEIDAIDKLKDAYDEEVEAAIDAIEKQKDAYDASIDAQIDKIEEMKDKYQEVLDLIGMSWEEYQAMLDATAMAEGMSLDSMGEYLVGFKENVIQNMKEIADAEAEVQRLTDAISGIDTSSSGSGGGGGGGTGTGIPGLGNAAFTASEKLQGLIKSIKESTDKISGYKEEEEALCQKLSEGNLTTSERVAAMTELSGKQAQIRDEEANLTDLAGQYVIALGEETDATDAYREAAILQLDMLTNGYNLSYETIFNTLQKHLEDVENTNSGTSELYDSMSQTVDLFSQNVAGTLDSLGGNFDTLVQKVQKAAEEIEKTCRSAIENIKKMNQEANNAGSGTKPKHALGTRSVAKSGRSLVDEEGPELIIRQSQSNGRYTYLERGDQVLPASYSKNLWDMGSNPSEWFEKQYSKFSRLDTKAVYAGGTTIYSPAFSGDIVITNPVGNSDDLARGLKQNLPTSFMQAIGVRS